MLKVVSSFFSSVFAKMISSAGPAAKEALASLDPKVNLHHTLRVHSKDSRLHCEVGLAIDASVNLPGDLDDMASGAINATGIVGLGNSPQVSSEAGTSPSN